MYPNNDPVMFMVAFYGCLLAEVIPVPIEVPLTRKVTLMELRGEIGRYGMKTKSDHQPLKAFHSTEQLPQPLSINTTCEAVRNMQQDFKNMEKYIDQRAVLSSCKWSICLSAVVWTTVALATITASDTFGAGDIVYLPSD